jgi:hypothetical protein
LDSLNKAIASEVGVTDTMVSVQLKNLRRAWIALKDCF